MLKAVLFDFDGTLAQLTIDFHEMRRLVLRDLALVLKQEPDEIKKSMPVVEMVEALCAEHPQLAAQMRERTEKIISNFEVEAAANSTLFPFTLPLLAKLGKADIKVGIVTRNCRAAVEKVFPDHASYCGILVDRGGVAPNFLKPHPEHLLTALRALGQHPEVAVMVGDHPMDIESGRAAGCITGAVLSGHSQAEAMHKAKPDYLAENALELFKLIGF